MIQMAEMTHDRMRPVTSMWCFQCGSEYRQGATECFECGVGLVSEPPLDADQVGSPDEPQIGYELHEWAFESRRMLDQLLTGAGIAHAWQGASLVIREADEEQVDELVEDVEHATLPTLDPEQEHTVYEMTDWTAEQQTRLSEMLGNLGIPHEFDVNGDLVVNISDEPDVDNALDRLEAAIASGEATEGITLDDDLELNQLLSDAFDAADKLKSNPRDAEAVLQYLDAAEIIEELAIPFGFDRAQWGDIKLTVSALLDALEDENPDDEIISERAKVARDRLVQII